ncbi:MAG: hypothetical protein A3B74_02110 [Candidatus Kerfeldbacteria bacterium RIFCSPHIGHO2_02_FULL_42_14]|uniref:Uncharacterized protein n=1 Tax=Candidatus Kerfeldbacteria bacterium RIFCSPHIGHO2_02_FULL_42_14 TaxID=1798540 RepID=A0A1G2ANI1_9BACT|nr:MAG: hypothetical protein A3B74_02110 [Candidatus Kerfeldbacteria bacterium RIFCSPHIGHO2_02_FULL_42_14]OGY81811.1 MAG: hypothetical protein A3E60_00685 [Candidatus Kerfeldbacteria bacterium RIFCSPHIGHO2_12_FULL_42_13]OGY84500.1 MAG: hypothetical protein A3I91_00300 [Candidatus Kerfeldbacteria bacterium RIFCSPLOWO2_02_FULL_42_19]OGY87607.1 MAG: hypothetical protein A3G01_02650 [Candidatus Kerfeldbacteria bacterium RIFCSPLOWO2_12_FULL_43_9]
MSAEAAENLQSMPVLPAAYQAQAARQLSREKQGRRLSAVPAPLGLDYGGAGMPSAESDAAEASNEASSATSAEGALDQKPVIQGAQLQQALRRSLGQRTKLAREGSEGAEEESKKGAVSDATATGVRLLTDNALTWCFRYCATFEPFGIVLVVLPYLNFHFCQAHLRGSQWFRKFKLWEIVVFILLDLLVIGIIASIFMLVILVVESAQKKAEITWRLIMGLVTGGISGLSGAAGSILGEELTQ